MSDAPRLLALATTVPRHRIEQLEVARQGARAFDRARSDFARLLPVFGNAGIEARYFCMPMDWYLLPHGWPERSRLFVEHAVELLAEVAGKCLAQAGCSVGAVDGIVAVSTTGVSTPSLDALLIERLRLRPDTRRLPLFGFGCAGGVIGLTRACEMASARPGSRILLLVVELCSLTFRQGDNSSGNIVASALFGDGASALLIGAGESGPLLLQGGEHTWPHSLDVMGWTIEPDGFGVLFSRDIPNIVRAEFAAAVDAFLMRHALDRRELAGYVCHPGGAKVIEAVEQSLNLTAGSLLEARQVLRDYGNMSAVTVLFVLQRMLARRRPGLYLMSALGPGFTAGFQLIDIA